MAECQSPKDMDEWMTRRIAERAAAVSGAGVAAATPVVTVEAADNAKGSGHLPVADVCMVMVGENDANDADQGHSTQAVRMNEEAVGVMPDDHVVWYNQGVDFIKQGPLSEAVSAYVKAAIIKAAMPKR